MDELHGIKIKSIFGIILYLGLFSDFIIGISKMLVNGRDENISV
ncbi:hypothetical protein SAMN05444362_10379 [Dysgonomonas macrotermitis]|uniref:Uncharacterized protein n=1 Tax=Dysgonomonas macrotermitis TaxID=1346286 RepID=A0A1M4Y5M9_9BACT|nr:hypothetical protein SAMN05444362_10379 [Dysgonomonas macrotermitis]